jgi:iron-sulfur cluster assembly accessory protein
MATRTLLFPNLLGLYGVGHPGSGWVGRSDEDSIELDPPEFSASRAMTTDTAVPAVAQATATPHTARDGKGIQITEPAMRQLATLMRQQGEAKVLRVGVRSGGCSGMSYTMDFIDADGIREDDERHVYEPADAPAFEVVCDPKSLLYIYGMQLDFSSALIGGGFNFTNPNASQTCGCGSSFAV